MIDKIKNSGHSKKYGYCEAFGGSMLFPSEENKVFANVGNGKTENQSVFLY